MNNDGFAIHWQGEVTKLTMLNGFDYLQNMHPTLLVANVELMDLNGSD